MHKKNRQPTTDNRQLILGFTLLEILTVISIISIIAVVSVNNLIKSREKFALEKTAQQIIFQLDTARDLSINYQNRRIYGIRFEPNPDNNQVVLFCDNCSVGEYADRIIQLAEPFTFTTLPAGNQIIFEQLSGRAAGPSINNLKTSNTTISLQSSRWQTSITIPPTGGIYQAPTTKL
jgi:prepilin-type N-terminal cleavage/methylation domain-containing protein